MRPDIAVRERAQDGVDQRMEAWIGVRMPREPAVVRNFYPSEPDVIAVREGMHVIAVAGPDIAERGELPGLGPGKILRRRELDVAGLAIKHVDRHAGPFGQGGIIGEMVAARRQRLAMGRQQGVEPEGLRSLETAQAGPLDR